MIHFIAVPAAWMVDADCARTDPEVFFPDVGSTNRRAKEICATCPSKAPCLQWALDNNEQYGVFGGTSRADRQRIKLAELRATEVARMRRPVYHRTEVKNTYETEMDAALSAEPPVIVWEPNGSGILVAVEVRDPHTTRPRKVGA